MEFGSNMIEKFDDINIIQHAKVLGRGNFGEVKQGLIKGELVAVKIIYNRGQQVTKEATKELNVMTKLSHKNIVKFLGIIDIDFNNEPKLVFEYVENGSLAKYVSSELREKNLLIRLCYDVICGMEYLHSKQFIHRDLAARNILVDAKLRAKVADFGLCRFLDIDASPDNYYYMIDGEKPLPLRWAPKETIQAIVTLGCVEGKFSFSSDVWAFGVTMWEVWTRGSVPYSRNGKTIPSTKVVEYINDGENPNSFDRPTDAPEEILDIMDDIFQVEKKLRPTFYQLQEKFETVFDPETFQDSSEDSTAVCGSKVAQYKVERSSSYLETHWWPTKKILVQALQRRKIGDVLLIEKLHEVLTSNRRRMTVICQTETAAKFTGLGGVGKTLTAKWYANHFESMYKHIIWINSGEDENLSKSFKCLARDLGVTNRHELQDLVTGCYEKLSKFKSLWIFDNVENYIGNEGIHDLLPINQTNFYCLFTSRSRENWGNDNGYGAISKFEITVFDETESIEFLKTHIDPEINFSEYQLKQLSEYMGRLPLALQLAVATLNNRKMDLQCYIEQISTTFDFNIIEEKFDDYERTINKNVTISLLQIQKEPKGKLAYNLFMIFGYIRPTYIQYDFLRSASGFSADDLDASLELLKKYLLITTSRKEKCFLNEGIFSKFLGKPSVEIEREVFTIHRLLQQVIRHHGKPTENETLRRILNCKGHLDYKLIPYLHANDALKNTFKKIRAKLIDQVFLKKLLTEKKFQQAVNLSKFIHQEDNSAASLYNYAICLKLKGENEEAMKLFKEIYATVNNEDSRESELFKSGIISLNSQPSPSYLEYLFLCDSLNSKGMDMEIIENESIHSASYNITLNMNFDDVNKLIHSLESSFVQNYSLHCYGDKTTLSLNSHAEVTSKYKIIHHKKAFKKILFTRCTINESHLFPKDIKSLCLIKVRFGSQNNGEYEKNVSSFDIENLNLTSFDRCFTQDGFLELDTLDLENCDVNLPPNPTQVSPQVVHLGEINVSQDGYHLDHIFVNEIIDFSRIEKLILCGSSNHTKISIDLSANLIVNEVQLLEHTQVVNWRTAKWKIQKLVLRDIPFNEKNEMEIMDLDTNSEVDISCLPNSVENLRISCSDSKSRGTISNSSQEQINLPKLKCLHMSVSRASSGLVNFIYCQNLIRLKIDFLPKVKTMWVTVQLNTIPKSVMEIEMNSNSGDGNFIVVGDEERHIDVLILGNIRLQFIENLLEKLVPNQLVIHCNDTEDAVNELMYCMSLESRVIPTILISTNQQVYYFKNNKRQAVSSKEFGIMFLKYFSK